MTGTEAREWEVCVVEPMKGEEEEEEEEEINQLFILYRG